MTRSVSWISNLKSSKLRKRWSKKKELGTNSEVLRHIPLPHWRIPRRHNDPSPTSASKSHIRTYGTGEHGDRLIRTYSLLLLEHRSGFQLRSIGRKAIRVDARHRVVDYRHRDGWWGKLCEIDPNPVFIVIGAQMDMACSPPESMTIAHQETAHPRNFSLSARSKNFWIYLWPPKTK